MYIFFDLNYTEMQTLIKIINVAFEKVCGFKNTLIIRNVQDVSHIMIHLGFYRKNYESFTNVIVIDYSELFGLQLF